MRAQYEAARVKAIGWQYWLGHFAITAEGSNRESALYKGRSLTAMQSMDDALAIFGTRLFFLMPRLNGRLGRWKWN